MQELSENPRIQATHTAVTALGVLLIALGAALVATDQGVLRQNRRAWLWGIWLSIAFEIDGTINGYVFFGRPGDQGTAVNMNAAALIVSFLVQGRRALDRRDWPSKREEVKRCSTRECSGRRCALPQAPKALDQFAALRASDFRPAPGSPLLQNNNAMTWRMN